MKTIINILGTDYEVKEMTEEEYPKLKIMGAVGLCEYNSKKIILDKNQLNIIQPYTLEGLEVSKREVLRHEIIHAFFHETGLCDYRDDEVLVDLLALQIPKLIKTFSELEILK